MNHRFRQFPAGGEVEVAEEDLSFPQAGDLFGLGLLDFDDQAGVAPGVLKEYKDKHPKDDKNKALGKIKHGGTIICCGYVVSRYRT